jgi:hypothetical protein
MSEVLELRNLPLLQSPAGVSPGNKNGQWESIIKPTYLYPGDSILSRQIFVDTKAQETGPETKIPIPETLFCTITFNLYNRNWRGAINKGDFASTTVGDKRNVDQTKSGIVPINPVENVNVAVNDGAIYVACTQKTIAVGEDFLHLDKIQYCARTYDAATKTGAFNIAVVYLNTSNVQTTDIITVPAVPAQSHNNQMFQFAADITYKQGGNISVPNQPQLGAPTPIAIFLVDANKNIIANSRMDVKEKQNAKASFKNCTFPVFVAPSIAKNPDSQSAGSELRTGEAYTPKQFTKTFIIEGGEGFLYDPIDLCKMINRQLTEIPPGTATANELTGGNTLLQHVGFDAPTTPTNNNLFNFFIQLTPQGDSPGYPFTDQLYGYNYNEAATAAIKETTTVQGQPANMGSVYAGASQVSINFNPDTKKFSFDFLHTPIFDDKSTSVGIVLTPTEPNPATNRVYPVPSNGGIIINQLLSETGAFGSGKSTTFFEETLGFAKKTTLANGAITYTMDHLLTNLKMTSKNSTNGDILVNGQPSTVPTATVKEGVNITAGFQGIDSVLSKGDLADQTAPFWQPPQLPTPLSAGGTVSANAIFSSQDKTVEIEADRSIFAANTQLPFGYFLVEVNANFQTKLKNPNGERGSIVSIVSRYYSQGSYTSASADSALVYKHTGQPTILTSFNCRILNSDGDLASVGGDNTVFLEIIRAPPPLPSPKELKKAAEMQKKSLEDSK